MKAIRSINLMVLASVLCYSCNKDEVIIDEVPAEEFGVEEFSVIEYMPAPGQFIGDPASGYADFKTMEEACGYARDRFVSCYPVSLGAWGGYMIVKARKSINNTGGYEFSIAGNAFDSSNEPGIVWVSRDDNGNGVADDTWYELRGSYFGKEGYERGYEVTYYRPETDRSDVRWTDSQGGSGSIKYMGMFHSQASYYPSWITADSYTLSGSKLPQRVEYDDATGSWTNFPYEWGYADNFGEDAAFVYLVIKGLTAQLNYFRISDAVDAEGNTVKLDAIDFIKVQTAVMGESGRLGENSTEICGFFLENM